MKIGNEIGFIGATELEADYNTGRWVIGWLRTAGEAFAFVIGMMLFLVVVFALMAALK